jgi:hypothetical protein
VGSVLAAEATEGVVGEDGAVDATGGWVFALVEVSPAFFLQPVNRAKDKHSTINFFIQITGDLFGSIVCRALLQSSPLPRRSLMRRSIRFDGRTSHQT